MRISDVLQNNLLVGSLKYFPIIKKGPSILCANASTTNALEIGLFFNLALIFVSIDKTIMMIIY